MLVLVTSFALLLLCSHLRLKLTEALQLATSSLHHHATPNSVHIPDHFFIAAYI